MFANATQTQNGIVNDGELIEVDPVDELEFSRETGRRAVYEALVVVREGDVAHVRNASHGQTEAEEHVYEVRLDDRGVPVSCDCPAFDYHCAPGEACKHMVGVALRAGHVQEDA